MARHQAKFSIPRVKSLNTNYRFGVQILRKWGSWENWLHDTAVITGLGRHYILVALTHHPQGDAYLTDLARAVDDLMGGGTTR